MPAKKGYVELVMQFVNNLIWIYIMTFFKLAALYFISPQVKVKQRKVTFTFISLNFYYFNEVSEVRLSIYKATSLALFFTLTRFD